MAKFLSSLWGAKRLSMTKNLDAINLIYFITQKQIIAIQKKKKTTHVPLAMPKDNWAKYLQYIAKLND